MADARTVVWFSAGAASAVAAKLTLADGPAVLAYTDPGSEHPDNDRFITDCEAWFGQKVLRLRSDRYADTWAVFEQRRFLNSPRGALCTTELKKMVRQEFQRADDVQVFGYTAEEVHRLGYRNNNCIGCVKGGMGYWNKIRRDFPDVFNRMALLERDIGATVLRADGDSVFLDELDPSRGNHDDEPSFECSLLCDVVDVEIARG